MSTFNDVRARKPTRMLMVPVSAFADDWRERPTAPVAVGLRLLSEKDCELAMSLAASATIEFFKGADQVNRAAVDDVYRSRMMAFAVARAVCDPNDVMQGHPLFPALEDQISEFFAPTGIAFIYEALDTMTVELSPLVPVATDEDLVLLRAHLRAGTVLKLPPGEQRAARRLLGRVVEALAAADPSVSIHDESDHFEDLPDQDEYGIPTYGVTLNG